MCIMSRKRGKYGAHFTSVGDKWTCDLCPGTSFIVNKASGTNCVRHHLKMKHPLLLEELDANYVSNKVAKTATSNPTATADAPPPRPRQNSSQQVRNGVVPVRMCELDFKQRYNAFLEMPVEEIADSYAQSKEFLVECDDQISILDEMISAINMKIETQHCLVDFLKTMASLTSVDLIEMEERALVDLLKQKRAKIDQKLIALKTKSGALSDNHAAKVAYERQFGSTIDPSPCHIAEQLVLE